MTQMITARAWRPQQFKDFVGQEYILESLKNAILESKVAHGYLFSGPRGVGKTSIARVFSMALNCLSPKMPLEPCLECKNCREIKEGRSPDVIEIDGASNRGIDDMREMRSNALFMPTYCRYKIYIIDEVHMLTTEAFNAILKILEEPPSYLVFLFATTEIHKVKGTIRSRCQQFYLKRLTQDQIYLQLLKIIKSQDISFSEEAIEMITRAADGSMRDAQSILDQVIVFSKGNITKNSVQEILGIPSLEEFIEGMDIIIHKDATRVRSFVSSLYARGEDLEFWILQFLELWRNLLLFQYGAKDTLDKEILSLLESRAPSFSLSQTQLLIDLFMDLFKDIKNAQREYFFLEGAFLKALNYSSFVTLAQVLEQIPCGDAYDQKDSETLSEPQQYKEAPVPNNVHIEVPPPTPKEEPKETASPLQTSKSSFQEWKEKIPSLREKKIMLDVKNAIYLESSEELSLEFLSKEAHKQFLETPSLQESLKEHFLKTGSSIKHLNAFVKEIDLSKSPKKAKEISKEEVLDLFAKELGATPIKEDPL